VAKDLPLQVGFTGSMASLTVLIIGLTVRTAAAVSQAAHEVHNAEILPHLNNDSAASFTNSF
jgi:hypothetical protein